MQDKLGPIVCLCAAIRWEMSSRHVPGDGCAKADERKKSKNNAWKIEKKKRR
jgi:hypothetical protein